MLVNYQENGLRSRKSEKNVSNNTRKNYLILVQSVTPVQKV